MCSTYLYTKQVFTGGMVNSLKEKMASEITLSEYPGMTLKKWRETFMVTQNQLAKKLDIKSSVISDYENGRRKSPGIGIIKKIINGLIEIDIENGSQIIKKYSKTFMEG